MGLEDKISNKAEDLGGKAKEAVGQTTGDDQLTGEGKADQITAAVKDGVENLKDTVGKIKDKLTDK